MAAAGSEGATLSILAKHQRTSLALIRIHLAANRSDFVRISFILAVTCVTRASIRFATRPGGR
jgi:hypothetical protein